MNQLPEYPPRGDGYHKFPGPGYQRTDGHPGRGPAPQPGAYSDGRHTLRPPAPPAYDHPYAAAQPAYAPPPPPAPQPAAAAPVKRRRRWPWIVGGVVLFFIVIGSLGNSRPSTTSSTPSGGGTAPAQVAPAAPAEAEPSGPVNAVGDGTYEVGVDLEPGRYKTAGPSDSSIVPMCYWARHKDDSGEFRSIIANDNLQGPGSVTVKAGEFVEFSGGCEWARS